MIEFLHGYVIANIIAGTTTRKGLKVRAELDHATYPTGVQVSDEQLAALHLNQHDWHGDWNYTLLGRRTRRTQRDRRDVELTCDLD